jgi:Flp pilus assembly protein TadD
MTSTPTNPASEVPGLIARATGLLEQGAFVEAIGLLQNAITTNPNNADIRFGLGVALLESGNAIAAAPVLLKATRLAPERLDPRLMLAKGFVKLGRTADALSVLRQTAQDFPNSSSVWLQRGALERDITDNVAAETSFRRAIALLPGDANALNNLGVALRAQNKLQDAIAVYHQALATAPNSALVHANLGNALDAAGQTSRAEQHLRQAVTLDQSSLDAQYNLAAHLIREEQPDEAIPVLRQILARQPARWDAWTNLGVGLTAIGVVDEAEHACREAVRLRQSAPEAHYNLAWVLLLTGQWREGWAEYEWRWQLPAFSSQQRLRASPPWDGTPQPHATILLHAEQGLGDTIQFVRLAHQVKRVCQRVILECPAGLVSLFAGVDGIDAIVAIGDELPAHNFHAQLLSLPRLLDLTPANVTNATPYLRARSQRPAHLGLPATDRKKIGFVWAGSADNKIDRRRSCEPAFFAKLTRAIDADFVSLQIGPNAEEEHRADLSNVVFSINGKCADWADTASVIAQLDLIIGVDTGVMHLAGAMGRPSWVLLPYSPDFRWLLNRYDTPWYGSMRLFRQRVRGDWSGLFEEVAAELTVWLRNQA